jgi:hypothetical protein
VATLAWFAIALLLMLVGLAGAVLPLLPGLPLVLAGVYLYALATGLAAGVGLGHLVVYTLIGGAAILLSSLANLWGVRAAGGSRAGVLGAMLGLLVSPAPRGGCAVLGSEPPQFVALGSGRAIVATARVQVGLLQPVTDGLPGAAEVAGELLV